MTVFVDTSAFYALLDADDENHPGARDCFNSWLEQEDVRFVTSNYVLVETWSLIQSRLGLSAVRSFQDGFGGLVEVRWVDEPLHQLAASSLLAANRRGLSLVDCASFEMARSLGIREVFAFDRHFREQGFLTLPQRRV